MVLREILKTQRTEDSYIVAQRELPGTLALLGGESQGPRVLGHLVNKGERKAGELLWGPRLSMERDFA